MSFDHIGSEDVAAWFDAASRKRAGAANRGFEILGTMTFHAEERGLCTRATTTHASISRRTRGRMLSVFPTWTNWSEAVVATNLLRSSGPAAVKCSVCVGSTLEG